MCGRVLTPLPCLPMQWPRVTYPLCESNTKVSKCDRNTTSCCSDKSTRPPPCISYANVHNYSGPYAYCSLDKGVACTQHIQLPTHTCAAGHMC